MNHTQTDAQVHRAALSYGARHGVSYSEAVRCVVASAQTAASSFAETPAAPGTDASAHAAAVRYAAEYGTDYLSAIKQVMTNAPASFAEGAPSGNQPQALTTQPIEIFRAGTHADSAGTNYVFSVADVMAIAANYSPQRHEAPLTLGHPRDDAPAYGWVKRLLATNDGRLWMVADQIDPAFAEGVRTGRYKKRSAEFYPPNSPHNPTPGQWYLKHVGWLGAMPPAIKGLADANFAAQASDGAHRFTF